VDASASAWLLAAQPEPSARAKQTISHFSAECAIGDFGGMLASGGHTLLRQAARAGD
jgi:hypothetical protein